jgi:hypothetical protein
MSTLEILPQISVKIWYCESRAVIGDVVVAIVVAFGIGFRAKLWCGMSQGRLGVRFRRKLMVCACVAARMRIEVKREGATQMSEKREATRPSSVPSEVSSTHSLIITSHAVHVSATDMPISARIE